MEEFSLFQPACLSVSDITRYIHELMEGDEILQEVWVEGEISNLARPQSGHCYFTLKDGGAALRCVIWRSTSVRISQQLANGSSIQAHGSIGVYEVQGNYQLYVDQVRPAGEGALYRQFIQLKEQLEAEGLFAPERKRPLPDWPACIGVATSPSGAALQDVLNCIARRFPLAEVVVAPAAVQGAEAPAELIRSLLYLDRMVQPDVILLVRGGGSLEDLWAFNDERLAYAIAGSSTPVVTGIGHETDFTIADFVADRRAPTPTAAAEIVTPEIGEMRAKLADSAGILAGRLSACLMDLRWQLKDAGGRLGFASPRRQVAQQRQQVDDMSLALLRNATHSLRLKSARLAGLAAQANALSPYGVFERGYAIVTRLADGNPVRRVLSVSQGDEIGIRLVDGSLEARVTGRKILPGTGPAGNTGAIP